jgi:hypothetical protein
MAHCPPGPHWVSLERVQAAACRIVRFLPNEKKARGFSSLVEDAIRRQIVGEESRHSP